MGVFDRWAIESRIRKLERKKTDLTDDSSSIRNINNSIDNVISDVRSFIRNGNSVIVSKLGEYKEPYQWNDHNLNMAGEYIQRDINYWRRQLEAADNDGGGGGSW